MSSFQIILTGFEFPAGLPNNRANFRFVVDLRYFDAKGNLATEHAVMPSLDTFWECDTSREAKPNYVRDATKPAFDMTKIDDWDSLVLHVRSKNLHSIQFKVVDVNRRDAWDAIRDFLGDLVQAFVGKLKGRIPDSNLVAQSLGGAADDVQSFLLKKLAGGEKVLFRGSQQLLASEKPGIVQGSGTGGAYKVQFEVRQN